MEDPLGLVVEGYTVCRCGTWLTDSEARESNLCWACRRELDIKIRQGQTVEVEGGDVELPRYLTGPDRNRLRQRSKAPYHRDPERARRDRRARERALRRLARIDKGLYEILLAQEKARVGLTPLRRAKRPPLQIDRDEVIDLIGETSAELEA